MHEIIQQWIVGEAWKCESSPQNKNISAPREKTNLFRTTRHSAESLAMKIKDLNRPCFHSGLFERFYNFLPFFSVHFKKVHSTQNIRKKYNSSGKNKITTFWVHWIVGFTSFAVRFSHQTVPWANCRCRPVASVQLLARAKLRRSALRHRRPPMTSSEWNRNKNELISTALKQNLLV